MKPKPLSTLKALTVPPTLPGGGGASPGGGPGAYGMMPGCTAGAAGGEAKFWLRAVGGMPSAALASAEGTGRLGS